MTENLIVFAKNPVVGNVKTRLAREIGHQKATAIYEHLLQHTLNVSRQFRGDVHVYFDEIPTSFQNSENCQLQKGSDLGKKLVNALNNHKLPFIVIGSDCPEISIDLIHDALDGLRSNDLVIGPAKDGGFYLLACKSFEQALFNAITWSTDQVLNELLRNARELGYTYSMIKELNDIDTLDDVNSTLSHLNIKVA